MIWGIISLIVLLIIIGLTIWLLIRQSNACPNKKQLNQSCSQTIDCNSGLICSAISGTTGTTGTTGKICKVNLGGVCATSSECGTGLTCNNGICIVSLGSAGGSCPCAGGFTCINNICKAIVGKPCLIDSDCATGICINNVCGVSGTTGSTGSNSSDCSSDSRRSDCDSSRSDCESSRSDTDCDSNSKTKFSSSSTNKSSKYFRSSSLFSCSDTDCEDTIYDKDSSRSDSDSLDSSSKRSNNSSSKCNKKCKNSSDTLSSSFSSNNFHIRRGVYVTNASNNDQTLFTSIEQPIIDIVKSTNTNFFLLLADGNIASGTNNSTTTLLTNKKMVRMIRFGTEVVGLSRNGKLYSRDKTITDAWEWERLKRFPCDVQFINSTNSPYSNMEVLTCRGKALLYTFSSNWKEGNVTSTRKTHEPRFYGANLSRFIDINERTNKGKTNDGTIIKHIKAAGFYPSGALVSVLVNDTFTHVRIIDSNAYFLFEQC